MNTDFYVVQTDFSDVQKGGVESTLEISSSPAMTFDGEDYKARVEGLCTPGPEQKGVSALYGLGIHDDISSARAAIAEQFPNATNVDHDGQPFKPDYDHIFEVYKVIKQ